MNRTRILLVNEDRLIQKSLYEMLCRLGYSVDLANSTKEALAYLNQNQCQIILADINAADGVKLLKKTKEKPHSSEIIILTSYGNIEAAVTSIKMGAFDYLVKPVEDERIVSCVERALANRSVSPQKTISVKDISKKQTAFSELVGNSLMMQEIYSLIERISNSKSTVLLRGESGTGKRVIARAIYKADKKGQDVPFVEISCGALSKGLIESELFGHTKGSFTDAVADRKGRFELANGGTLLLDDIDALSLDMQVKLLRVIQHKEFERVGDHKTIKVDVRIIASTNQDLEKAVEEKQFREDLYYRLNVISLHVPPLRERKEDLALLVEHFINFYGKENHKKIGKISEEALRILTSYNWPGNIRQLENIIERAVILDTDGAISKNDLPEIILNGVAVLQPGLGLTTGVPLSLKDALKEPEKTYILKVLKEVGWNKRRAAKKLGVNRTTLYNKLRKHNIAPSLNK